METNSTKTVNKTNNNENSNAIFDLIQNIQTKINNENEETKKENLGSNIKQENQSNAEKNHNVDNTVHKENVQSNNNFDISSIASLLKNVDVSNILNMLGGNGNSATTERTDDGNNFSFGDFDPNMISKIQNVMKSMNKNDPKRDLLKSLKPFLRKSRQDKLNEYMTMLTVADAIGIFGSKGSD